MKLAFPFVLVHKTVQSLKRMHLYYNKKCLKYIYIYTYVCAYIFDYIDTDRKGG